MSKEMNRRDLFKLAAATTAVATVPVGEAEAKSYKDKVYPKGGRIKLSLPISKLKDEYDVVVIGSGYGGAIAAARLASRYKLCLLERGKEWMPGEFPDRARQIKKEVYSRLRPLGLYKFSQYGDVNVLMGSGLGGTSLINANILIKPDPKIFEDTVWPSEIRNAYQTGEISGLFSQVNSILGGERYPKNQKLVPKANLHKFSTKQMGLKHEYANLTVNYSKINNRKNQFGVFQNLCTHCGDCVTGCNYGAKHTLDMNYLPLAKQNGAEIFCQVTVTHVQKMGENDYRVHYKYHKKNRKKSTIKGYISTKKVIFGAGTMGTNKLLHASAKEGLNLSPRLGMGFSGNADILMFGYNSKYKSNILGTGANNKKINNKGIGPTIVGIARHNKSNDYKNHFLVEEGAIPKGLAFLVERFTHNFTGRELLKPRNWMRMIRDVFNIGRAGAINHSMLYLGMGHDDADGQIVLDKKGRIKVKWEGLEKKPIFEAIRNGTKAHCAHLKSKFISPPLGKPTTVHPLGGASMGEDVKKGVTNYKGQLFDPEKGAKGVHEGLYVTDASLIPTSLGVNPLLTISALAERIVRDI